ncbi:MAG: aminotransferase class V-fold PLP-dependent enzyme [Deltaproteobacteria bacterium]|nr:aminotransferase class V-fold PLP-dependent enzyme [Deltaproteobacteria bacterium]
MGSLTSQRHLFDIPEEVAYFNTAYYSPQLNESRDRLHDGVNTKSHPWERIPDNFFHDAETIRQLSSDIFGGNSDGFAVIPAASYGISTAARAIEPTLQPGDQILVIAEEFPSNVLPWKRTALETGAEIITVSEPIDGNWTQAILDRIINGVKVVAVSTCHWTNGLNIDLLPIGKACRDINAVLVVDATQTFAAMPFSIENVQPDFLIAAGYKWLLCSYGFGLLYVSERWRNARPLEETWLARDNAENFSALVKYSDTYMPGARRFDVGEKCTATILPGAVAALEQIKTWGVEEISNSLSLINKTIAVHLESLGFELPDESQRCPHMFGALLPKQYKGNLVSELARRNIYISQRGNALRFSPHLHVNDNDINRLLEALEELVR